jgi:hypothetical protein
MTPHEVVLSASLGERGVCVLRRAHDGIEILLLARDVDPATVRLERLGSG